MKKWSVSLLVAAVCVTAGYWYFSPYVVMLSMRSAIQARDADAFNAHVDYLSVRESLKAQLTALASERMDDSRTPASGTEALGKVLGRVLIDRMVDALVRPEAVMRAMDQGVIELRRHPPPERPTDPPEAARKSWRVERTGTDRVIVSRDDPQRNGRQVVAVVFDRRGFADWKLTELRLPAK